MVIYLILCVYIYILEEFGYTLSSSSFSMVSEIISQHKTSDAICESKLRQLVFSLTQLEP